MFSPPMVRAMLAGRKTQTRRLAWQHLAYLDAVEGTGKGFGATLWQSVKPGDRLWVREPFMVDGSALVYAADGREFAHTSSCDQRGLDLWQKITDGRYKTPRPARWMPKWANRLVLTVWQTRIERVQEISDEDALAEGILPAFVKGRTMYANFGAWAYDDRNMYASIDAIAPTAHLAYGKLWDELHGQGAWASNREVVAMSYEVERRNIEAT